MAEGTEHVSSVSSVSLAELIELALQNNPKVQSASLEARAKGARVPQVQALEDPMLMTTAFIQAMQTADGPQNLMMSVSQKFPWFGKRGLRGHVAYHDAMAGYSRLAVMKLEVATEVKQAYYDLYAMDRAIEVNRSLEPRLKEVIAVARSKYETSAEQVGLESVLQAEVELSQLNAELIEWQQAKRRARAMLMRAVGETDRSAIDVAAEYASTTVPSRVDHLIVLLEQCQPELRAKRREVSRDRTAIAVARKDYFPDPIVGFDWYAMSAPGLSPFATGMDSYSMTMGVNMPIYRKRLDAAVREAQYNASRSMREYEAELILRTSEIETLHALITEHDQILNLLEKEIVPRAEQTFSLSLEAYRVDRIDFQQLISNYKMVLEYQNQIYQRRAKREQAAAALENALGCVVAGISSPQSDAPLPAAAGQTSR